MKNMKKITLEALRWYLVQHQRLDHKIKAKDYQTLFSAISAIQFDPLDVIGQNLELALFARMEDVTRLKIHNLLYEDYKIIDGWDKMMSVFLREDWRYLHFVRERRAEREISIITHRKNTEALQYEEEVKEILQQQEDVYARDLILGSANDGVGGVVVIAVFVLIICFIREKLLFRIGESRTRHIVRLQDYLKVASYRLRSFQSRRNFCCGILCAESKQLVLIGLKMEMGGSVNLFQRKQFAWRYWKN